MLPKLTGCCLVLALLAIASGQCEAADSGPPEQAAEGVNPAGPPPPVEKTPGPPPKGIASWFNPKTAPFLPIPEIAVDPDSGTTLGVIPTWLVTDENHDIRRIIAPDIIYNRNFGWGVHGRIYGYPSADEQWSLVAGIKERVERGFDAEYQQGRLRDTRWSFNYSLIFDRDGTPRFYGIGNNSPLADQTNYTNQQQFAQAQVGYNFTQQWQLQYTGRLQVVDVLPGTLEGVPTLESVFGPIQGVGTSKLFLNRLALVYNTMDNLTIPTKGMQWVAYGGMASSNGWPGASLYSEAGVDGRTYWKVAPRTVVAFHMALRYLPSAHDVPFWALSSIGGGQSVIGGPQPLRGFGEGRFVDRNSFSSSVEVRQKVLSLNIMSTHMDLEVAPFVDVGRVFASTSTNPLSALHKVFGVGFRGVASPFVVGYVDIGYGTEGTAVFTGISYPF